MPLYFLKPYEDFAFFRLYNNAFKFIFLHKYAYFKKTNCRNISSVEDIVNTETYVKQNYF